MFKLHIKGFLLSEGTLVGEVDNGFKVVCEYRYKVVYFIITPVLNKPKINNLTIVVHIPDDITNYQVMRYTVQNGVVSDDCLYDLHNEHLITFIELYLPLSYLRKAYTEFARLYRLAISNMLEDYTSLHEDSRVLLCAEDSTGV